MADIREKYTFDVAGAWQKKLDDTMHQALTLSPRPIKPLTRWQKIHWELTKKRSLGRWLTYKLMNHYDIYEGDY